ncbi:MAG: WecB/TagA/CpsF family glycosyltransferase [Xanthobacteraceae bacterium]|nr:WecB/TagA/CpsF family glycosyltransferase [Xanthobacteraceae bacterium]
MRAEFLGTPIDLLTLEETAVLAVDAMLARKPTHHVALNVAKLVNMRRNDELRRDVTDSDIVSIDGMGIVWGARALGIEVPERVSGVDLMERLLEICSQLEFRPYFLGATQDVLERATLVALDRWPGLIFAGSRNGYFSKDEEEQVVEDIRSAKPDCLFIAMPTPRKERFLRKYRDELNVPFIMGVGGSLDVLAGHVSRAPLRMQRAGLEWLYRVYQEPRRMWWRYANTNAVYAGLLARAWLARRVRPGRAVNAN